MEDTLRDVGIRFAQSLPLAIAGAVVLTVLLGWLLIKVAKGDLGTTDTKPYWVVGILLVAAITLGGFSTSLAKARSYCAYVRSNHASLVPTAPVGWDPSVNFYDELMKCDNLDAFFGGGQ